MNCNSEMKITREFFLKLLEKNNFNHDIVNGVDKYKLNISFDTDGAEVNSNLEISVYNDRASAVEYTTVRECGGFSRTSNGIYNKSFTDVLMFIKKYINYYNVDNNTEDTVEEKVTIKEQSIIDDIDGQLPKEVNEFNMSSFLDDLQTLINKYRKYV